MKNVMIVNGNASYRGMWEAFGYIPTSKLYDADVVQFTGGADVTPSYYGEDSHPHTGNNIVRDVAEQGIFNYCLENEIPMAGICRGGQFLNVMNQGKMYQHCDGHAIHGTHKARIEESGLIVDVTSTHHQIMRPNYDDAIILMRSAEKLSTYMEYMADGEIQNEENGDEIEAVFYPRTMSLCFQPHPEYCDANSSCVNAYRSFLRNYLELDV